MCPITMSIMLLVLVVNDWDFRITCKTGHFSHVGLTLNKCQSIFFGLNVENKLIRLRNAFKCLKILKNKTKQTCALAKVSRSWLFKIFSCDSLQSEKGLLTCVLWTNQSSLDFRFVLNSVTFSFEQRFSLARDHCCMSYLSFSSHVSCLSILTTVYYRKKKAFNFWR